MPRYDGVQISQAGAGIMMVKFSRPPHNFIEVPLIAAIADAYHEIGAMPEARVIVLASEGRHFCAGGDFSGVAGGSAGSAAAALVPSQFGNAAYAEGARMMEAPLPVIAAIQGAAVGGGLGLACTADFRVGSAETRLVPNFARLGIHHGFGLTVTLPRIVGSQRATELLLTGKRIHGEEGYRIGLLDRLVKGQDLEAAALAFAAEITSSAPQSIRAIRATMRQGLADQFRAATLWESQEQGRLSSTEDFREGVRANAERRPPHFTGR